jgi:cyclopropane-fatty-acyl-phospholipid synthase
MTTDVHADRLLAHATASRSISVAERWTGGAAARAMHLLLARIRTDRLHVVERIPGRPRRDRSYGPGGELTATVTVVDRRAYAAVLAEGSIGFGRGYIEGWWTSDDPVAVVRVVIRNMATIDRIRNRWEALTGWATDRLRAVRPHDSRERNRDDIQAHYDIGNSFFELFLDETMTYSSAVFPTPDTPLADASRYKYDLLLDRLGLRPDDHLLEIGTGWGGMAIRAAHRGARVTTTTISREQLDEAEKRVANEGLTDRVTVLDRDWRDLTGTHDGLVSIEMIEAVSWRDYDDFFATIERRLAPGGRAAIQAIVLPDDRWERAKKTEDFIRRFVFPNGYLPSVAAIDESLRRATSLRIERLDDIGPHYAETLRQWRERFDARLAEVAALGLDDRFQRLWRFYLAYCEAGFHERHCSVVQIVLRDPASPVPGTASTRRADEPVSV